MSSNTTASDTWAKPTGNVDDAEYHAYLGRLGAGFASRAAKFGSQLFTTSATGLWDLYIGTFPESERQFHTCNACRRFIERFGGLAFIGPDLEIVPAMWDVEDAPEDLRRATELMHREVKRAAITGVFASADRTWGEPKTGAWIHMAVSPMSAMIHRDPVSTPYQAAAAKAHDRETLVRALGEFTVDHVNAAVTLLRSDALYRSEKVLGAAEFLQRVQADLASTPKARRETLLWREVAKSPTGFCHPRSGMIGTLLDDIAAGKDFADVSRAFAAKMHPLAYQRPQAAPSSGEVAAAERVIEALAAQGSLARRFARLDEVQALWRPRKDAQEPEKGGVFGKVQTKGSAPSAPAIQAPAKAVTWAKFSRDVLPTAIRIEAKTPQIGSYGALLTAANPDAPPILQWDREEARNPVSWYVYTGGSRREAWAISGVLVEVTAIALQPSMWHGGFEHQGEGLFIALTGARETRKPSACLFPEILRSELRVARRVIEAFSKLPENAPTGQSEPHAAGLVLSAQSINVSLRVWTATGVTDYTIDRWE